MISESVVLLFSDVVKSTELASRLSPEVADEVRRDHFVILRRALAETGGTEVKHLGDGLMAAFNSATAALSCAVAMQQGVDRDNRSQSHTIGLRVGLSCGEVTKDDGDYFGEPVIEAARLCAACTGGQILAARVVALMAGRRNPHECRPFGDLTLAGLPEAVETVEVQWEPLPDVNRDTAGIPLPRRLSFRPAVGVVGRDREIHMIREAVERVATDVDHELLLISGEPGLGKTTLVAESARTAFEGGACVLFGHCEEDLATPYELFAESLGHYVTHAPEEHLLEHVELYGSELARLVPMLAERVPGLSPSKGTDAETERYLLFAAVIGLLAAASAREPVVVVLDDLQWADAGSLALLRHLAATDQSIRVLFLGTYRDSELSTADKLRDTLGVLHRHRSLSRIDLTGLDDAAVVAYIEKAAGHSLDEAGVALAHEVYLETDGNPFFVSEVLRHLTETGVITQDASGRWIATNGEERISLPDSVREVVGGRVARLGPEAARVLSVAAVMGRDFDLDLLVDATGADEDALLDVLDAATAVALVREVSGSPGSYTFAHALIQHTMYEDLGLTRRARAHRQVAEALEARGEELSQSRIGELARHWMNATQPIDLPKAIEYSRRAGDAALAALAPAEALRYFNQALELCDQGEHTDPVVVIDVAIRRGIAQRQTGDPGYRETLLVAASEAAAIGETERLVSAALANDRGFYSAVGTTDVEKVSVLETALDALPGDSSDRALVLATLCSEIAHGSTLERRKELADEAVAIAERAGDDATVVRVLNHVYVPLQVPHLLDVALVRTTNALARAELVGDPALTFWAAMWRGETAARAGDIEEFDRCIEIHGAMAARLGQPMFDWGHTFSKGLRALIAGDTDRAEELAAQALQIGTDSGQPDATLIFGAQLMIVSGQRGTMSELIPLIEGMAADAPDISPWLFGSLLAKAHVEAGRIEEASQKLEEFAAADFDMSFDQTWLTGMVDYAEAAIECREPKYALPLFERLLPWAGQLPATGASALAPVSLYLGGLAAVLGRFDEADAYFAQSAAMSERIGAAFFAARTDLLLGRMLATRRAAGDTERVRDVLARARESAAMNNYANVQQLAERELERL